MSLLQSAPIGGNNVSLRQSLHTQNLLGDGGERRWAQKDMASSLSVDQQEVTEVLEKHPVGGESSLYLLM